MCVSKCINFCDSFTMYVKAQNHAHHLFDIFGVAFILYGNEKVK